MTKNDFQEKLKALGDQDLFLGEKTTESKDSSDAKATGKCSALPSCGGGGGKCGDLPGCSGSGGGGKCSALPSCGGGGGKCGDLPNCSGGGGKCGDLPTCGGSSKKPETHGKCGALPSCGGDGHGDCGDSTDCPHGDYDDDGHGHGKCGAFINCGGDGNCGKTAKCSYGGGHSASLIDCDGGNGSCGVPYSCVGS